MRLAKLLADTLPPALKRFKYLATLSSTEQAAASIQDQIDNYLCELQQSLWPGCKFFLRQVFS
jgi:hypothetical protein